VALRLETVKISNKYTFQFSHYELQTTKLYPNFHFELTKTRPTWLLSAQKNFESESYIKMVF